MTHDVHRWLMHLTQVSGSLTSSLDYDATLRHVVRLPIPTLADWCMVYVPDDGGPLPARLVVAHASPAREALLRKVWQHEWATLPERHPIAESLRWRSPIVLPHCDAAVLERLSGAPEHSALLRKVGIRSMLVLPLAAHGTVVGSLMLVSAQARRRVYDEKLLDLLNELARCYAQAIYNARLFVEARLAVRLRDDLIQAARHELLELVAGMTERHRERARILAWPGSHQAAADHPHQASGRSSPPNEFHSFAAEMERIAHRLGAAVDPYAASASA
jgi:GAF domain-containing protein